MYFMENIYIICGRRVFINAETILFLTVIPLFRFNEFLRHEMWYNGETVIRITRNVSCYYVRMQELNENS
jgi:hypothetical protein